MKIAVVVVFSLVTCALRSVEAITCYDCIDGTGHCSPSDPLFSTYYTPAVCSGFCGYRCTSAGVLSRICSEKYPSVNYAANVGKVVSFDQELYYLCSGDKCHQYALTCAAMAASLTTTATTTTTTTTTTPTTPTTTTTPLPPVAGKCYECPMTTAACASNNVNFENFSVGCKGYCGYRCKPGELMQRICSTTYYLPNLVVGSNFYWSDYKYFFCTGPNCNSATMRC